MKLLTFRCNALQQFLIKRKHFIKNNYKTKTESMDFIKTSLSLHQGLVQRVFRTKHIFLFVIMLLVNFSFAQTEIISDSTKAKPDSIATNTPAVETKIKSSPDSIKNDSNSAENILYSEHKKVSKRVDTVFFLEIAKPALTESSATFDAGQNFSTFKFTDSQGNKEKDFSANITGCFSLGYQYVKKSGLFIRSNVGMRKGGASLTFDGLDINWTIQYADVNVGIGYISNKWRLKPYFSASPYFAYMLKANETIGTSNVDIKKDKSFKTTDFGIFISPGLRIALTNSVAFYAEYKYILGLQNIETAADQKAFNRGFSVNLGISFTIEKLRLPPPTVLPKNGRKVKNFMKNKEGKTEPAN